MDELEAWAAQLEECRKHVAERLIELPSGTRTLGNSDPFSDEVSGGALNALAPYLPPL